MQHQCGHCLNQPFGLLKFWEITLGANDLSKRDGESLLRFALRHNTHKRVGERGLINKLITIHTESWVHVYGAVYLETHGVLHRRFFIFSTYYHFLSKEHTLNTEHRLWFCHTQSRWICLLNCTCRSFQSVSGNVHCTAIYSLLTGYKSAIAATNNRLCTNIMNCTGPGPLSGYLNGGWLTELLAKVNTSISSK